MLTSLVDGVTRNRLINARATAMRYGASAGLALLSVDAVMPPAARVALFMQQCELLYLDQQFDDAGKIYDDDIEPLLEHLPPECSSLLADNRSIISFALFHADGSDQFNHQIDIRRILGIELRNSSAALEAERNAKAGKHYEALPLVWRILLETYQKQNWRALRGAHSHMAREYIALNWPDEAVWHAVQALDEDLVVEAANALMVLKDSNRITKAIDRALMFSQLAKHAYLAAHFLSTIADCIPDDRLEFVTPWLVDHLQFVPTEWKHSSIYKPAWQLAGKLAPRIHADLLLGFAQIAVDHPFFTQGNSARKHLIDACNGIFQQISQDLLIQFIPSVINLITTYKSDFDFVDSVNLVYLFAEKSESCRNEIKLALFPPGVQVSNPTLLILASLLECQLQDEETINASAARIASSTRKQVEVLDETAEPSKLGGFGQITKSKGSEKIVVHMAGNQHLIDAIAAYISRLSDTSVSQLVEALLEMIIDDRNIVSNRVSLTQSLKKFIPRLTLELAQRTSQILGQIARGNFSESDVAPTYQEAKNPLNPFKISSGDPFDLISIAGVTLAYGSIFHSEFRTELHSGVLLGLLEAEHEKLRKYGVAASLEAESLTESETTALITNCFDSSSEVRKYALYALGSVLSLALDRQGLLLAVRAIKNASNSIDANERAEASRAAKSLLRQATDDGEIETRLKNILNDLTGDISWWVRNCASENGSRESQGDENNLATKGTIQKRQKGSRPKKPKNHQNTGTLRKKNNSKSATALPSS